MNPEPQTSDAIRDAQKREATAACNRDALARLQRDKNLTLPYASYESWRPTKRATGNIPGFERQFTILCTDGVVAWFEDVFEVLFYGHIQHFTGSVEPLHSLPYTGTPKAGARKGKEKSVRAPKITVTNALEALRQAFEKQM